MKAVPAGWWFAAAFACLPGPLLRAQRQHLVTVHVAAQDSMGEPIPDLRAPDLRVFDNGKPRGIALFRRSDPRPLVDPLAPNEYTNRPKAPLPHTLVILLDLLNEPLLTGSSFRQDLVNVLGHLESAEGIYLYVLTNHGDMYPIHGLGSTEPSWRIQAGPTLDKVLRRNSGFRFGYADYGVRSMITWPRLSQLASRLLPYLAARPCSGLREECPTRWIRSALRPSISPLLCGKQE